MEKYYVSQLDDLNQRHSINKLLEVRFSRRPSTFGVLYVTELTNKTNKNQLVPGGVPSFKSHETAKHHGPTGHHDQPGPHETWLRLATLSLTLDNKAKFMIVKEVQLKRVDAPAGQRKPLQPTLVVADFDTISSGQLLIEGSSSASASQALQSAVFVLTDDGQLLVATMIDCVARELTSIRRVTEEVKAQSGQAGSHKGLRALSERFIQVSALRQHTKKGFAPTDASSSASSAQHATVNVLALSDECLYNYSITLNNNNPKSPLQDCAVHLNYKHVVQPQVGGQSSSQVLDNKLNPTKKNVKFSRMVPMATESEPGLVLLELSDSSMRILKQADCLANLAAPCQVASPTQCLSLFTSASNLGEPSILLTLTRSNQLVAHSLVINLDDDHASATQSESKGNLDDDNNTDDDEALNVFERPRKRRQMNRNHEDKDPDRLLPEEPNFELEQCWSIDLNEIDGVRSMFDDDDEEEEENQADEEAGMRQRDLKASFLCLPIWSASDQTPKRATISMDSEGELPGGQEAGWPRLLLVMCKHHLFVFNFEHANVLPFSVVYDRAFLNLTAQSAQVESPQTNITTQEQLQDKRIDLRLRPRLLHNFKLIGTRASDSLFNMLYLTCKIYLVQAKNFHHLGLLAAISSQGHVFVFKLTSSKLLEPNHKNNLYQQLLIDSLRDSSLLQDELNRMRKFETELKDQISRLELQVAAIGQDELSATTINTNLIQDDRLKTMVHSARPEPNQMMTADMLEVRCSLQQHESLGGLYRLIICWPSLLLTVTRVIIVSTVDGSQLQAPIQELGQIDSITTRPGIRRSTVLNNEQAGGNVEQLFQEPSSEPEELKEATKARAVIELEPEEGGDQVEDVHLWESVCSQRCQLDVPISLDEFKVGQLKIYLIFSLPFSDHLTPFGAHRFMLQTNQQPRRNEIHTRFIKRELPIKPLNSYRFVSNEFHPTKQHDNLKTLSFSGSVGVEKALCWLEGLIDISDDHKPKSYKEATLMFQSTSRLSTLQVKLTPNDLLFNSQDLKTLELIKRHILKEATNDSIQLKPGIVHD